MGIIPVTRSYDEQQQLQEFKIKAVEILEQGHKSVRQVAKEPGVAA